LPPENAACYQWSPDLTVAATSAFTALYSSTTSALTVLAETASNATQLSNNSEIKIISQQIQHQLNAKVAALQQAPDTSLATALQSQITTLTSHRAAVAAIATAAGANGNLLSDLQNQLAKLQTDATAGNSAGFDATLAAAKTDNLDMTASTPPAPIQPNGIGGLQGKGLGISSSATYNLSTPAGKAAAANAIQAAQTLVGQVFQVATSNQLLAADIQTSLTTQIGTLTTQQQQQSQADQLGATAQILKLTQLAQNQTHLIELALGGTSAVAKMVSLATNPPQPYTSVFQALEAAVGSTGTQKNAPPILSLLA
jgi:hypothetical protein